MSDRRKLEPMKTKPITLDYQELSASDAPKELKIMDPQNLRGIENTAKVIGFAADMANVVKKVTAPDSTSGQKISITEVASFIPPALHLPSVIAAAIELPAELVDKITPEEMAILEGEIKKIEYLAENANVQDCVTDGLKLVNDIKTYMQKYFF